MAAIEGRFDATIYANNLNEEDKNKLDDFISEYKDYINDSGLYGEIDIEWLYCLDDDYSNKGNCWVATWDTAALTADFFKKLGEKLPNVSATCEGCTDYCGSGEGSRYDHYSLRGGVLRWTYEENDEYDEDEYDEDEYDEDEYDEKACELMEEGKYEEAKAAFEALDGYYDSHDKVIEANEAIIEQMRLGNTEAKVGQTCYFGQYEQDNNTENGKEAIEWRILDKDGNKVLVLSEKCLDSIPYNYEYEDTTWETCSLRTWLNNDFYSEAFNESEKNAIFESDITNDNNLEYGTNGGSNTKDKIFLLSIEEAKKYFESDSDRQAAGTAYVADNGNSWWWLRSPGCVSSRAAGVYFDGWVYESGTFVNIVYYGIRPACWVDISNL